MNTLLLNVQKNLANVNNYQRKMASSKEISRPSDNPIEIPRVLSLRQAISDTEQYRKNIDDSLGWLKSTDVSLSQLSSYFGQISELTQFAANDTSSGGDRANIAVEIESIKQQIIEAANSSYTGRYLFSGTMTKTAPIDATLSYAGDALKINREIGRNNEASINIVASDIFKADPSIAYDSITNNVLTKIDELVVALNKEKDGFGRTGSNEISTYLTVFKPVIENVTAVNIDIGYKINSLEDVYSKHGDALFNLSELLSKKEDVDMTRLITELTVAENVYEASLAATARLSIPSLMDFLS